MTVTSRLIVGPFNRVEGDLEVTLDIQDAVVAEARVTAPLYRGFERILLARPVSDALVIAPRICGICSVSQSVAAARALARVSGTDQPANGRLAADLILAAENAADHLTHFVLFFMPDFARSCYAGRGWFEAARRRFAADLGEASRSLLPARARFLHLMGILAGKWPHSLALQPGGVTKAVDAAERLRLLSIIGEFREALETVVFADRLENFAALDSLAALAAWADARPMDHGDARLFLHIGRDLGLDRLGRGPGLLASSGSFGLFAAGLWNADGGGLGPFDPARITEDVACAWMAGDAPLPPFAGLTLPDADKPGAYSWCKAPRLDGKVVEVGALARQVVDGHPLARALVGAGGGGSVLARVVGRLLELARLIPAMEDWTRNLRPGEPFCLAPPDTAVTGAAIGMVEAARGTLGHWLSARDGRIAAYQIVAPTTWNFSPRDAAGRPGALEQALVGTPALPGEASPIAVQHVVRSFDPCMVCTVH
ncbi:nickel-dependent hydrogenase large subunit [Magnetospirillum sp. SS-4]|uniref:nickel-dependent hydrogenase large subunit n=1 Tax=Magnetospirillum sp. SS-4 TaxID=2681465 RepID=UPI00137F30D0|nr:nickel-dependent hydrogenase large subunit [Magnetospirillum sp. SS-4]CAA7620084.1 Uptake hydrogenase [Magnetospirillum sp. SS-4]